MDEKGTTVIGDGEEVTVDIPITTEMGAAERKALPLEHTSNAVIGGDRVSFKEKLLELKGQMEETVKPAPETVIARKAGVLE